jgi:PTS system N-acetylglucosamine-specific IIC component
LQVVLGPIADQVAGEIREAARADRGAPSLAAMPAASTPAAQPVDADAWFAALGGRDNVSGGVCSTRLYLTLTDPAAVDDAGLRRLGARALARPSPASLHVVIGPQAQALAHALGLAPA